MIHVCGFSVTDKVSRIFDRRVDHRHVQVRLDIILRVLLHVVRSILGGVFLHGHVAFHDEVFDLFLP